MKVTKTFENALEYRNKSNQLHRGNGPAKTITRGLYKGSTYWFKKGHRHRIGGPAVEEYRNESPYNTEYWLYGYLCHSVTEHAFLAKQIGLGKCTIDYDYPRKGRILIFSCDKAKAMYLLKFS